LEDAAELSKGSPERAKRIIPVIIDVTKQDEVAACFETVRTTLEKSGKKLEAVINNAGLGFNLPTEILPEDRMRYLWEVNYFGALRVTRVFLPLLREAPQDRRRIVFVGSVSSGGMTKFFATYSASKAAVEVSADELRRELLPWGVKVSVIEPGVFHTKFTKNTGIAKTEFESMVAGGSELAKSYEAKYLKFWKTAMYPPHIPGNGLNRVAEAIDYCVRARFPPAKRGVGTESHLLQGLAMVVPDSVQDFLVGMVL
jgi:NAD(P)-dependent dehydrogenase (short-subunit alcohol dehydrogenase family)